MIDMMVIIFINVNNNCDLDSQIYIYMIILEKNFLNITNIETYI